MDSFLVFLNLNFGTDIENRRLLIRGKECSKNVKLWLVEVV